MSKTRLEAFSDGVIAIIITIMVLELRPPHEESITALRDVLPHFISYVLSFVFVGIYWTNHHHMFQAIHRVDGKILWANMHLLFWLSLTPFLTAWMGETHFASWPVAAYGLVLLLDGVAYLLLEKCLLASNPGDSVLAKAVGHGHKERISLLAYALAIPMAFFLPRVSCAVYALVALAWFVPDRRIEKVFSDQAS